MGKYIDKIEDISLKRERGIPMGEEESKAWNRWNNCMNSMFGLIRLISLLKVTPKNQQYDMDDFNSLIEKTMTDDA